MRVGRDLALFFAAVLTVALYVAGTMPAQADNGLGRPSIASSKHPNQSSIGRTRVGLGQFATYGTATDIDVLSSTDDGATRPFRVPLYSAIDLACTTTGGWVCFSMTPNSDDINISATGEITDANGADGYGSCFFCSGYYSQAFEITHFTTTTSVLARTGECYDNSPVAATGRPCRIAADCAGAYTCDTATDHLAGGDMLYGYIITPAATNPINGVMVDVQGQGP